MKIVLVEKTVTRGHRERLESITKKTIGNYFSDHIPRIGEVICYVNGNYYDVLQVIHTVTETKDGQCRLAERVVLEVKLHSNTHLYSGKENFEEEIPLVTQMSSTTWIPTNIDE